MSADTFQAVIQAATTVAFSESAWGEGGVLAPICMNYGTQANPKHSTE